jgi:uncharacterized protein (TIGR00251 family)
MKQRNAGTTLTLKVKVKPNACTSELVKSADGEWFASLKAAPVDGKANLELIALVARHFGCPKADVTIKSGASGRMKWVQVTGVGGEHSAG